MWQISLPRIQRVAIVLGVIGAVVVAILQSPVDAVGFLVGAVISLATIQSWARLAESLAPRTAGQSAPSYAGPGGKKAGSPAAAGAFMMLRYVIIGGAIYVTIKVLGVTPVTLLAGMLVSFVAVIVEILYLAFKPR